MNRHLGALHALATRRTGLGDLADDVLVAIFPQVNAKIDQKANEIRAEVIKKGDEASTKALIGGFTAGLLGVAIGYGISRLV